MPKFDEITLRHGCFPLKMLHIFRAPSPKNSSKWLLLKLFDWKNRIHYITFNKKKTRMISLSSQFYRSSKYCMQASFC